MADEQTIPLSFDAVDNLSKAVDRMTAALDKMEGQQKDTEKATEQATDATKEQGKEAEVTTSRWEQLAAKLELATAAYEYVAAGVGFLSEKIATSLEKWDEQSRKLGVAASALGSVAEANAKAEKASDKLYASVGRIIDRSSVLQAVQLASASATTRLQKVVDKNREAWAKWINGAAIEAAESLQDLGKWIDANAELLARLGLLVIGTGQAFGVGVRTIGLFAQALKVLLLEAVELTMTALGGLTEGLATLIEDDFPELAEQLKLGASAFKDAEAAMSDMSDTAQGELLASLEEAGAAGEELQKTFGAAFGDGDELLAAHTERWRALGKEVETYGKDVEANLKRGMAGPGRARTDGTPAPIPQMPMPDYAGIIQQAIASRNELIAIEDQARAEQLAWEEAQDAKAAERFERTMTRIAARQEADTAYIESVAGALEEGFGRVPDLIDGVTEATERMAAGLGQASAQGGKLFKALNDIRVANATGAKSQQAINDAIAGSAGVLSGVTAAFIANKKQQAAIEAAINAAAAIASVANGDLRAAATYGLAAAQYGLIAGGAFGGGGGGGAGAASGGATGATPQVDLERERRANAEAIAEAIAAGGERQTVQINVDFGNALIASDSPQAVQSIASMLEPELRRLLT